MYFTDRRDAGRRLARRLEHLKDRNVVVLGLPRGGVPVAAEVARVLGAPLDVILVRKLGVPGHAELGMGAIGEGGVRVITREVVREAGVTEAELGRVEAREGVELERRVRRYRGAEPPADIRGRTVVVVDDGIATGATARAACQVARARGATHIILAVPVAPLGWGAGFGDVVDESVCVAEPADFFGVGQFYVDFAQTTDEEVVACLAEAAHRSRPAGPAAPAPGPGGDTRTGVDTGAETGADTDVDTDVVIRSGPLGLPGRLTVPAGATGIVLFAHGSGSSRHSPRNRYVAEQLNRAGLATLLFDLLTPDEERDRGNVFDVGLLAGRLGDATDQIRESPDTRRLPVGYFGASTGAAAALWAAAEPDSPVAAVVSRGGRADLAGQRLPAVIAPTLLIVGGRDSVVLDLNRRAAELLGGYRRLAVVEGATHLFAEPGALEKVAELAGQWFSEHLAGVPSGR